MPKVIKKGVYLRFVSVLETPAHYRNFKYKEVKNMWEMIDRKEVFDSDGFRTEYTLYCDEERFVCVFGDSELYGPEDDSNWDFETESPTEAYEWFHMVKGV